MKLAGRMAVFHLTEDGKSLIKQIVGDSAYEAVTANVGETVSSEVEETDDMGVWLRLYRKPDSRFFLLRWDFILGVELSAEPGKIVGLRG